MSRPLLCAIGGALFVVLTFGSLRAHASVDMHPVHHDDSSSTIELNVPPVRGHGRFGATLALVQMLMSHYADKPIEATACSAPLDADEIRKLLGHDGLLVVWVEGGGPERPLLVYGIRTEQRLAQT